MRNPEQVSHSQKKGSGIRRRVENLPLQIALPRPVAEFDFTTAQLPALALTLHQAAG